MDDLIPAILGKVAKPKPAALRRINGRLPPPLPGPQVPIIPPRVIGGARG